MEQKIYIVATFCRETRLYLHPILLEQVISYGYRDLNAYAVRENIENYFVNPAGKKASNFNKVQDTRGTVDFPGCQRVKTFFWSF